MLNTTISHTNSQQPHIRIGDNSAYNSKIARPIHTASIKPSGQLVHARGQAVKAVQANVGDATYGWVEGYLVSWGNDTDRDLQGEFFSPRTEFCLDWFKDRPCLYHHGMDGQAGLRRIGFIKSVEADDLGLWVQAQLDLRDRYAQAVYDMVKSKEFGWSSGSVDHLVKIGDNGEILVWPLIEGSITPTPAQPAKTTVRAFKALIADDTDYLREFALHTTIVGSEGISPADISLPKGYVKSINKLGDNEMAYTSSHRIARRVARALGVKVDPSELDAVATEVEGVIDDEVAQAAEELEQEASFAALEDEMIGASSYRSRRARRNTRSRNTRSRHPVRARRGYGHRSDDADADDIAVEMADEITEKVEDELAANMEDLTASMADELAAEMVSEATDQAKAMIARRRAKQAMRSRAIARARRQIKQGLDATDDTVFDLDTEEAAPAGGGDTTEHLGEAAAASYRRRARRSLNGRRPTRARRDYGYRNNEDELPVMADDELPVMADDELAAESALIEEVAERAYRHGLARGLRAAQDELGDPDAPTIEGDDSDLGSPIASYRGRRRPVRRFNSSRRSIRRPVRRPTRARRGYGHRSDDADADDVALNAVEENELGYAAYEDEQAAMDEELTGKRYGRRRSRRTRIKSSDTADYWRRRAVKAELSEAPGQRNFGAIKSVKDVADKPGSYEHAFKSYLYKGDTRLTETEKYVLEGKGKVNWGPMKSSFAFDPRTNSYKTLYGGSDASAGYAVPPDWVSELNKNIMTQTTMAPECRTRTTTSDRIVQPNLVTTDGRRAHAATVRWPGEEIAAASEHTTTQDTYSQVDVPIHLMLLSLAVSNSALEDVTFNLEDEVNEAFSEAVAVMYDELIYGGDGQGKLEGIVTNPAVTTSASTGVSSVSGYVATGSIDGIITPDTLKAMLFHLPRGYKQKAKWYMNTNTALQIATLKDGTGNYFIDQRLESIQNTGVPDKLFGRPIVFNEYADDIAENAFPVVFGDLTRGYLIGKRVDFSIRRFDDSNYATLDQVLFLGRARLGGQVLTPAAMKVMKVATS